jgi:hypothetical protein
MEEQDLGDLLHGCGMQENEICIDMDGLYSMYRTDKSSGMDVRVIAYTNAAVRAHNLHIRKELGYMEPLMVGELLTGYTNVGWPVPMIENGTDYLVSGMRHTTRHQIDTYMGLVGWLIDLVDLDDHTHTSKNLFVIDIQNSANVRFMQDLVRRAEKVNQRYSTKNDFKHYQELKQRVVCIEDVYKYGGQVMTETNLRQQHPLLFTKVSEVINTQRNSIVVSELTAKLEDQYGQIIEGRIYDNKAFADAEVFADQYMVVEKDLYYGYAITAHKSQGSTYDIAYVDEHDFKKLSNKWNFKLRAIEQRHKEKNQLKYVAYTRASKKLLIVV